MAEWQVQTVHGRAVWGLEYRRKRVFVLDTGKWQGPSEAGALTSFQALYWALEHTYF